MTSDRAFNEGPAGSSGHTVQPGECAESIAYANHHRWEKLWEFPDNQELNDARESHNILLPGDQIVIPPVTEKEVEIPTGETQHVFRRTGGKTTIRIKLRSRGKPIEEQPYSLEVGSHTSDGTTGPSGEIEATIPVGELQGTLKVGESGKEEEYELLLGRLDPLNELSGVKGRLNNLGFDCGQPDSQETPTTRHAVQVFQASREVEPTGDPDQTTLDGLREAHEN